MNALKKNYLFFLSLLSLVMFLVAFGAACNQTGATSDGDEGSGDGKPPVEKLRDDSDQDPGDDPEPEVCNCDDGDICTVDSCDANNMCVNTPAAPDSDSDGYEDLACGASDCHDDNEDVNPGQSEYFSDAYTTTSGTESHDYDCSGSEERRWTQMNVNPCTIPAGDCEREGWRPVAGSPTGVPDCGETQQYVECFRGIPGFSDCVENVEMRKQECK